MGMFICMRCEGKGPGERFHVPDTDEGEAKIIQHLAEDHREYTLTDQLRSILNGSVSYAE